MIVPVDGLGADDVVRLLDLAPHPEGGFYRETFRDPATSNGRAVSTAIYFLLREGEVSSWHKVDAAEIWHWYSGASLTLSISHSGDGPITEYRLGGRLLDGERPQEIVPANAWQRAEAIGGWTLVGCTVAPGFEFEKFELAAEGWSPGPST